MFRSIALFAIPMLIVANTAWAEDKPAAHKAIIDSIGPTLVNAKGEEFKTADLAEKKYVVLYFSASWCPPCKKFTPNLVKFYNDHAAKANFDVILVGADRSAEKQAAYLTDFNMPFKAVPFEALAEGTLPRKFGVRGIPHLAILDAEGNQVASSVVDGEYIGCDAVLERFAEVLKG